MPGGSPSSQGTARLLPDISSLQFLFVFSSGEVPIVDLAVFIVFEVVGDVESSNPFHCPCNSSYSRVERRAAAELSDKTEVNIPSPRLSGPGNRNGAFFHLETSLRRGRVSSRLSRLRKSRHSEQDLLFALADRAANAKHDGTAKAGPARTENFNACLHGMRRWKRAIAMG